ncbi:hypothetical protein HaLaN_01201 [Haematococcus lacustris]|uniref:Uncharacterized protein n=1 Tax=Haematococcus lacustris TaxID=44745 RepID=A0A699YU51_HAELA|nr:hypothetical protein HaLaN_01201 [Haematococcus lacustris]
MHPAGPTSCKNTASHSHSCLPQALSQYDPAPRPKQDLEQLVSAVEKELPFLSSSSQVEQTSQLLASSEVMRRAGWRDWSNLLHGLATAGMQCSSSPDLTWLCDQAVQLLPHKLAKGAAGQDIISDSCHQPG